MNAAERRLALLGLGGVATTTWGTELILARVTSVPQVPADALQSLFGLALIAAIPGVPALFIKNNHLRGTLLGASALAPVLVVMWGILGPVLEARNGFVSSAALISVGIVGAWRLVEAWRGSDPFRLVFPWLAVSAAAFGAWASRSQPMPSITMLLGFLVLGAVLVVLPRLSGGLGIAVLYGLCAGLWPTGAPEIAWPNAVPDSTSPDIVLITVDTLRADDASVMRSYQSIAADGVRFSNTQAASSWTLPSMATILTGRADAAQGSGAPTSGRVRGIEGIDTLGSRFAAAGYDTAAVLAENPYVSRRFGFDQGFAVFDSAVEAGRHALPTGKLDPTVGRPFLARLIGHPGPALSYAGSLGGRAVHVVRRRRDQPLFLWVHFLDPHTPYRFAGELEEVKALPPDLERDLRVVAGRQLIRRDALFGSPEGRTLLRASYRNEVARVDDAIAAILVELSAGRHSRDHVVVLTSDHGEEFFEHGRFEHGHSFHQELLDVPLVISGLGGTRAGQRGVEETAVVGHLDIAPTLLAAAGIPDTDLQGRDLAGPIEPRALVSEGLLYGPGKRERYAVREGAWKLVVDRGGKRRLFDLEADPGERRDVASLHPDIVARLAQAPRAADSEGRGGAVVDDSLRRSLRALGYIEDGEKEP